MLELRTNCENCNQDLPNESKEAMICSFECTFCRDCVENILHNVCPNCGGGFSPRPIRPQEFISKYPPTEKVVYKPIDQTNFVVLLERFKDVDPSDR